MEREINRNREIPSDDEISKQKNFKKLVDEFRKNSLNDAKSKHAKNASLKKWVYSSVIAGAVVVCTVTMSQLNNKSNESNSKKSEKNSSNKTTSDKAISNLSSVSKVTSPVNGKINVNKKKYKINASTGGVIKHTTSSEIRIPKEAFVNKKGEVIKDEVEIHYREFHDIAEVIGSGIPMNYDSAGVKYNFESAGMFEIKGYCNGEEISVQQGKKIEINLASQKEGDRFNFYRLDTMNGNWIPLPAQKGKVKPFQEAKKYAVNNSNLFYRGNNLSVSNEEKEKISNEYEAKIAALPELEIPVKPRSVTDKNRLFRLAVNYKEFPELKLFKNCVFEVGSENENYSEDFLKIDWDDLKLEAGNEKQRNYILLLRAGNRTEKLIVYPVFEKEEFESAQMKYKNSMKEYQEMVAKNKKTEDSLRFEMELAISRGKANVNSGLQANQTDYAMLEEKKAKVFRSFSIDSFGIFNSDCAEKYPSDEFISAVFNCNEKVLSPKMIYLISNDKKMMFTYSSFSFDSIGLKKESTYSIICFAEGKIYHCSEEDFQNRKKRNKYTVFDLKDVTGLGSNIDEFRKVIL